MDWLKDDDKVILESYMASHHPHVSDDIVRNTDVFDMLHKYFILDRLSP